MPTCDVVMDVTPVLGVTAPTKAKTWTVTLTTGEVRAVEAAACRIEHGTVIFSEAASLSLAIASGEWRQVEAEVLS